MAWLAALSALSSMSQSGRDQQAQQKQEGMAQMNIGSRKLLQEAIQRLVGNSASSSSTP
jgi:hypothetical protein